MMARAARVLLAGISFWGCATEAPQSDTDAIRAYVREVTGDDLRVGGLHVQTNDVVSDGHIAKVRGSVTNGYGESVEGVRYLVSIYEDGPTPAVLDRWQYEVDTTIEPGDRRMMRLDIESMYWGRSGRTRFNIEATPVKVGGKDVPPPAEWK